MDNAYGAETNFVVDDNDNNKTMMAYSQQAIEEVDTKCKSPCSSSAEMCIAMCG